MPARLKRERRIACNYINVRRRRQIWIACLTTCDSGLHGAALVLRAHRFRAIRARRAGSTTPAVRMQAGFR